MTAICALVVTGLALVAPEVALASTTSHESPRTVRLNCSADGGDQRTTADASVQPGVIVADSSGWPISRDVKPFTCDPGGQLEIIGPLSTVSTTDHLVSAWENSTDCFDFPSHETRGGGGCKRIRDR